MHVLMLPLSGLGIHVTIASQEKFGSFTLYMLELIKQH